MRLMNRLNTRKNQEIRLWRSPYYKDRRQILHALYRIWLGNPPRVALTSIKVDDFLNKRWFWEKPILISPPGIDDKDACIFPEKVNGKYVIFHRIMPEIVIDFVDI